MSAARPVVQLLLTGSEIMSGDTVDSNSALVARRLAALGLAIHRKVTVGDDLALLRREIEALSRDSDVLIVNGGLGPTVDDLTAEALALAAGVALEQDAAALAHVRRWCARRNARLNEANLKQALLPSGSAAVENSVGSAVGIRMEWNGCLIFCTPGVPGELRPMLEPIVEQLAARLGLARRVEICRLQTFGLGEAAAQQMIADSRMDWPPEVALGFRAGAPQMEIKLTVQSREQCALLAACKRRIYRLFGDHIIGEGDCALAQRVLELLRERGETLATAESCTGGLIASMLTREPGASQAFHAGFVTYANDIKTAVLGVSGRALERHGAVSEPVVRAMALGALERAGADHAIAVSGVAGPGGGSGDKPAGTAWLAWGSRARLAARRLRWPVERGLFQTMIAAAGLDLLRRRLLGLEGEPRYFSSD